MMSTNHSSSLEGLIPTRPYTDVLRERKLGHATE